MREHAKHHVLAAAAAITLATAEPASAQTAGGVQIYGLMAAGVSYKSHQTGASTELSNNLTNGAHIGFRGTEDLGDGLRALFQLESGIATDTGIAGGSGGKFWNRNSTVGLSNGTFTATLGRQFHASTDRVVRSLDVFSVSGSSLHVTPLALFGVNKFANNDSRSDDTVKLRWNGPAGVTSGVSVAFEDGFARSAAFDLAQITRDYTIAVYGVKFKSPNVIAATGTRPIYQAYGGGGQYRLGNTVLYLNVLRSEADATAGGRPRQTNDLVIPGILVELAPVLLKASYTHDRGRNINNVTGRDGDKKTAIVAMEYLFSKRTAASFSLFSNSFTGGYKLDPVNIAGLGRDPTSPSTSGYSVGIRHNF